MGRANQFSQQYVDYRNSSGGSYAENTYRLGTSPGWKGLRDQKEVTESEVAEEAIGWLGRLSSSLILPSAFFLSHPRLESLFTGVKRRHLTCTSSTLPVSVSSVSLSASSLSLSSSESSCPWPPGMIPSLSSFLSHVGA